MLSIKDFKVGDIAYSVLMNKGRNAQPIIFEKKVTTVGRKYVTVDDGQRYENFNCEYLNEVAVYGERRMLFRSRKDAEDYLEKCSLALWLGCMSVSKFEKYSIEQLREVKEILSVQ